MASRAAVELSDTERRNIEQACAALSVEYCEVVDAQDYASLREVFAEDAVFARPTNPDQVLRGVDAIIASFVSRPRMRITQHLVFNVRVRPESADAAAGSCRILLYTADAAEPQSLEGRKAAAKRLIGVYRDRYVRTPSGWRIVERRGETLLHTD
jgi:ketosteroid isomerase-like protein